MNRRREILIIVLGILLVVSCIAAYEMHFRWKWAVESYKRQLRAAGEKLTVEELVPPPIPPEQNSADTFRKAFFSWQGSNWDFNAFSKLNLPLPMQFIGPAKAFARAMQPRIDLRTTNAWAEADAAVGQRRDTLNLLQQIIDRPAFDFRFDFKQGFLLESRELIGMRDASLLLSGASVCDLHRGDTAAALLKIRAMLALTKGLEREPCLSSEQVRSGIISRSVGATWEFLQSPGVTGEQLATLQRDWSSLESVQTLERAVEMERAANDGVLVDWRSSSSKFRAGLKRAFVNGSDEPSSAWFELPQAAWRGTILRVESGLWRFSWSYADELLALKNYQTVLSAVRLAQTNRSLPPFQEEWKRMAEWHTEGQKNFWLLNFFAPELHYFFAGCAHNAAYQFQRAEVNEVARQQVVAAIALKRYQLKYGKYPPDLNSLVPEFISAVPLDVVDGQPLRYRRNADGTFLLYSIGGDGKDDGGNPGSAPYYSYLQSWLMARDRIYDWVWPQPATPEEIQAYYNRRKSGN